MKRFAILFVLVTSLAATSLYGQSVACPGLHNPTSFNTPAGSRGSWSARVGDRVNNGVSGSTGSNVLSTCSRPNKPAIKGNTNITSSLYYSGNCPHRCGSCNHCTLFDGHDQRFRIYTQADAGLDAFTINNGQGMQRIPSGHTSSIRLGDMRATGSCVSDINTDGNNKGSEALFYTMFVTSQNALLFIDYAIVACRYTHDPYEAGEFIIRVCGKNSSTGQWNNYPLHDSLWFNVPAPAIGGTLPAPWVEGLPGGPSGATTCGYCYKPWTRVAINLIDYIYDSVRIEMYTSDCVYNVDPIYAYIAGSCQPIQISTSGCPAGENTNIDTLWAPADLLTYTWYVSTEGYDGPITNTQYLIDNVPFRQVQGTTNARNWYVSTLDDFIVPNGATMDTVGVQTYKCVMTSAMDPAKPFHSTLYCQVGNTKPIINANFNIECHDTAIIEMNAHGHIAYRGPNAPEIVDSLTQWIFYDGSDAETPAVDTLYGRNVVYRTPLSGDHAVRLTMYSSDSTCYTSRVYVIHIDTPPDTRIDISKKTLCEGEQVTITDLTTDIIAREWHFADTVIYGQGNSMNSTRSVTRDFTESTNPFMLITTGPSDCKDTLYDTIFFFKDPEINFSSDTIICNGHESHVRVSTPVPGCSFSWYRHKDQPGETPICTGDILYVRPTQPHTTYYVKISADEAGCVAWDSVTLSLLTTKITVTPPHAKHCPGDSVTLTGSGALWYEWTSYPPDPELDAQAHNQTIVVSPHQDTRYYLTGYAADSCDIAAISVLVKEIPLPILDFEYAPHYIDTETPVVSFTDLSQNRYSTKWNFGDGGFSTGEHINHYFDIYADSCNYVTMHTLNELGCARDTTWMIPIDTFGFYRPNVFTPSKATNNVFQIISYSKMDKFHISIFNRGGARVFSSDDPHFVWDGTHDGKPCPQGAYPYVITYTRAGSITEYRIKGVVTLLR